MDQNYQVTTIAGNSKPGYKDGNALESMFRGPTAICASSNGRVYIIDSFNHRIRMIYTNKVTTIAGNGQEGFKDGNALNAMFCRPQGICISNDDKIFVSDTFNGRIRMVHNNEVTTIAGNGKMGFKDGDALEAMFYSPWAICISNDNILYVSDTFNHNIRMIYGNKVITMAGNRAKGYRDGRAFKAMFNSPRGICISKDNRLYVSDADNHRIRMIYNNQVTTIAGNGQRGFKDGNVLDAMFGRPQGICISTDDKIYVADTDNYRIRMIDNNKVTNIAGNGQQGFQDGNALESMFSLPHGICTSNDGKIYIIDSMKHRIRMIHNDKKSPFGFALLLDMQNTFCDCQISFNNITYHLHSTLINVRCPLLLDQSYFSLLQQSNISNESFDSFVTFLYSNKFTKEQNQTWQRSMSMKIIVEMIFLFDLLVMNCKSILQQLKRRFTNELIETLKMNQSIRQLIFDLLPCVHNLKQQIKTKKVQSYISYTEYCYNLIAHELQQRRSIVERFLAELKLDALDEYYASFKNDTMSDTTQTEKIAHQSMIDFGFELTELSKLAFQKTNICKIEDNNHDTISESTTISTQHLNAWTRPDFVIKLWNDDDNISYDVHKIVLCGRWKYFCQMIESGMKESKDNEMTLSDDWSKSRFEKMMKYIYLNEIEFESFEDIAWLMENGKLYGMIVDQQRNEDSYNDDESRNNQTAAYGFEALYDHCVGASNH